MGEEFGLLVPRAEVTLHDVPPEQGQIGTRLGLRGFRHVLFRLKLIRQEIGIVGETLLAVDLEGVLLLALLELALAQALVTLEVKKHLLQLAFFCFRQRVGLGLREAQLFLQRLLGWLRLGCVGLMLREPLFLLCRLVH